MFYYNINFTETQGAAVVFNVTLLANTNGKNNVIPLFANQIYSMIIYR